MKNIMMRNQKEAKKEHFFGVKKERSRARFSMKFG